MGVLVECPHCKYRNSLKSENCTKCSESIRKLAGKTYWIEYYDDKKTRRRERIGNSKGAAEQRYREVLTAKAEDRHIKKDLNAKVTLTELCKWYIDLPDVKAKKTYRKEFSSIKNLKRLLGENTKIREITPGRVEIYQTKRLSEESPRHPGKKVKPSTVNRELSCLKGMLNRAVRHNFINTNPISASKRLPENNVRERVLSQTQFENLVTACDIHLKPVVTIAYYLGMRKSEILYLTWDEVDIREGFINLSEDRTKTKVARSIPLHPEVTNILRRIPRSIHTNRVFLRHGKPFDDIKRSFSTACRKAGLTDFTFHDLRHCAINNLRVAGNDYFKIMAISGHKTISVFKRYNLVTAEELQNVVWENTGEVESAD